MNKWIGISLGTLFGISHIAMIGLLSKKSSVPMISPPVGPYTSYMIEAGKEGYKISYRAYLVQQPVIKVKHVLKQSDQQKEQVV